MPTAAATPGIVLRRWTEIAGAERLLPGLDAVFFESSLTKSFADDAARSAFRERWLGRYLKHDPQFAYIALDRDTVAGYLIGSVDDPAATERFRDVAVPAFAAASQRFPAHLHVNLAPEYRNRALGSRLIDAFVADLEARNVPGVHVVTGAGSRNVAFYNRNGFAEAARARLGSSEVVFLGRTLRAPRQE
jgi:ribosomal protein S18 acetylase RimI-like enzyme